MSRVTPPVTKFTQIIKRSLSTTPNAGRSSKLFESARASSKSELSQSETTTHGFHNLASHRPTPTVYRPLMQGFRTNIPKSLHTPAISTIESFTFPQIPALHASANPVSPFSIRVPLLPDSYTASHPVEALDEAVPRSEISIVAAHPENVVPVAMSEVVGNDGLEVDLGLLARGAGIVEDVKEAVREREMGVIGELWGAVLEDLRAVGQKDVRVAV
ncbi:hypothetical protein HYFRA_00004130 [Hymenoscyphus fraxineus]|uniref:Uncharacterized protein n=1 Tax=Hymenoscyphus fraxineus TaxID=746836 RepID=A0A9N9PKE7_9HELO|nr:hypothetical protein HYFRA_00004130 [Hymenoscyphus fraxineus]